MIYHPKLQKTKLLRLVFVITEGLILFFACGVPEVRSAPTSNQGKESSVLFESSPRLTNIKAWVSNTRPKQNTKITAYCEVTDKNGQPIRGVRVTFKWKYKTSTKTITSMTDNNGIASVSRRIGRAVKGYKVIIEITAQYNKVTEKVKTSFTPQ